MNSILRKIFDIVLDAPKEKEFLNWVFGKQKSDLLLGTPVVLFGTGNLGKDFLLALNKQGVYPVSFCNSYVKSMGEFYQGLPVLSLEELKRSHMSSLIVIATQTYAADVKKLLINNGFHRDQILWNPDFDMLTSLYFNPTNQYTTDISRIHTEDEWIEIITKQQDRVLEGFNILADDKSRDLFVSKVATMIAHKNVGLFKEYMFKHSEAIKEFGLICFQPYGPENYFYFNNDVFSLSKDEIYMDVGAHDGDSVIEFVQACVNNRIDYKHIYAFEPDPHYYSSLLEATEGYSKISRHRIGIWSHSARVRFSSSEISIADGASCICDGGDVEIETVSVDEFLDGREISLLKMDPPGNILCDAIQGARNTIRKYKPKLALGAYHSVEAIYEMPILINRICPDYRIYLRHNSWGIGETDLFAVV